MPQKVKTYVLYGSGQDMGILLAYHNRKDCEIIYHKDGESIENCLKRIHPPANVIVQCHGGPDATFTWNANSPRSPYTRLFHALPKRGIASVTLTTCYGGSAQVAAILKAAPEGLLVQALTGVHTLDSGDVNIKFAEETAGLKKPIDLYLKALDNFDPVEYAVYIDYWSIKHKAIYIGDAEQALPRILGIGGKSPIIIDLEKSFRILHEKTGDPALKSAISRVQKLFDTKHIHTFININTLETTRNDISLGNPSEEALDASIALMAQKLASGYKPKDAEEKRIAYAITAAYLDESGELQRIKQGSRPSSGLIV